MAITPETLPVCRACDLDSQPVEQAWLIESLWAQSAVGIIGGAPKCCKSWLGLDMAVSVASATPCLGHFPVRKKGPALVFMAEDALPSVRDRIQAICAHRGIALAELDLFVITAVSIRIDLQADQDRLANTLEQLKPCFVLLDPLVRMHRIDENSAAEISHLLGFIRQMQRTFDTAITLVHHASKKHRAQPGQALRGSSDLHAFGDSNAYLSRRDKKLVLTLEHRAAKPPDPFEVDLVSRADGTATHLAIASIVVQHQTASLDERVIIILNNTDKPLTGTSLRERLKVNNQRLSQTLDALEKQGRIVRVDKGWCAVSKTPENNDTIPFML